MDTNQAQIIDGRATAQKTRNEIRTRVQILQQRGYLVRSHE